MFSNKMGDVTVERWAEGKDMSVVEGVELN